MMLSPAARQRRRRVERSAALLDGVKPDWRAHINTATLDLEDAHRCILGQLWGNYGEGKFRLGITTIDASRYAFISLGNAEKTRAEWLRVIGNQS